MIIRKWTILTKKKLKINIIRFLDKYGDYSPMRGGIHMAILTSCRCGGFFIAKDKAKDFLEKSKKNIISEELLKECEEASKLFEEDDEF